MKLITEELIKSVPKLMTTSELVDPMIQCKFFLPGTGWTWYLIEYDGIDLMYGYVVGFERELGYFSLSELESINGPYLLGVERDRYFTPRPLSRVK